MEAIYKVNEYLANDATMQTLFGSTASNFPIYPLYEPPERPVPYVLYKNKTTVMSKQYWLFRDTAVYVVYCDSIKKSGEIQNRMIQLIGLEKDYNAVPDVGDASYDFKRFQFLGSTLYEPREEGGLHERHLLFQWDYTWSGVE